MTNHRITSQPWQLKAAAEGTLGTIILPFGQYCEDQRSIVEDCRSGKACRDGDGNWIFWCPGNNAELEYLTLKNYPMGSGKGFRIPFKEGDRIYLAEEWVKAPWGNDNGKITGYIYFTKSRVPEAEHIGWQPAETMPEEAAQHWFELGDVRVVQMSAIDRHLCDRAALTDIPSDLPCGVEEWASILMRWNAAHPDYFWDSDRWVIVLDLNIIGEPNGRNA
jgi:hypothetical protein